MIMVIDLYPHCFKPALESVNGSLSCILCKNNAAYIKPYLRENIHQTDNISIVCYAEVTPDFVFFDIGRADYNNDLSLVLKLKKHLQLAVRLEAR